MKTLLLATLAAAIAGFTNPVIPGMHPDPSACRVGEDYYLVNSSFQFFPGVPLFHSRDLIHWEQIGNVLTRDSQLPVPNANCWGGIYAPTIRYNDGTFYMITTNVSDKGNFLVHTTDPAGEWSDPVWLEQGGIDPSLYFEDGVCYMVSNPDGCIYLCTIDPETGKTLTPSKPLWGGDGGRYPESPHIYKRGGWYYLMISEGGTEFGHSVTIARSRKIDGPYKSNPNNPILTHFNQRKQGCEIQGCGHADLVQAHDGSWWAVFLGFRIQNGNHHCLGRETFLAPVTWTSDGWPVIGDAGTIDTEMTCATLPQYGVPQRPDELLSEGRQLPCMVNLNNPVHENYTFDADGLLMRSSAVTLDEEKTSSFVGVAQDSHDMTASTLLEIPANAKGEAGMTVYGAHFCHAEVYARPVGGALKLGAKAPLYGLKHQFDEVTVPAGKVRVGIAATKFGYNFFAETAAGKRLELGFLESRLFSSETIGGFTGVMFGLYSRNDEGAAAFDTRFRDFVWAAPRAPYVPSEGNLAAREKFSADRFGIFIHWGIYSLLGDGEWKMQVAGIPMSEYSKLAPQFNPVKFNAEEWVSAIKGAGARYITITSRHHDGFSMYATKASPYNIIDATPFGRDPLKELSDECEKQGITLNFYYSQVDWGREDYFPLGDTGHQAGRRNKAGELGTLKDYYEFMDEQITELLTGYKIGALWFDGMWDRDGEGEGNTPERWNMPHQYALIHSINPDCLIASNHHRAPHDGEDIQVFERDLPGENTSGYSPTGVVSRLPLETCQTMNGSWGYRESDKNYKTPTELIQYLVRTAGKGANLLLNIGPKSDGTIPEEALAGLKAMGDWLSANGETIYGTVAGPVLPQEWGATTAAGKKIYVHVMQTPESGVIELPVKARIKSCKVFGTSGKVRFRRRKGTLTITPGAVPEGCPDKIIEICTR